MKDTERSRSAQVNLFSCDGQMIAFVFAQLLHGRTGMIGVDDEARLVRRGRGPGKDARFLAELREEAIRNGTPRKARRTP